jgi:hypothetical protein
LKLTFLQGSPFQRIKKFPQRDLSAFVDFSAFWKTIKASSISISLQHTIQPSDIVKLNKKSFPAAKWHTACLEVKSDKYHVRIKINLIQGGQK